MAAHGDPEMSIAWIPRTEWDAAITRWPSWADDYGASTHDDYRLHIETQLRAIRSAGTSKLSLSPLHIDEYAAWCETAGIDPEGATGRARFAAELSSLGLPRIAWPPGRNEPCWCESGQKYKQCCGALMIDALPGDDAVIPLFDNLDDLDLPDVATGPWGYVRVELLSGRDLVLDPPPGRTFLVAPYHDLCDLSMAIDRAFARWDLSHLHEFELADGTRLGHDPNEELGWEDEHDHLVLDLGEPGTEFTYTFDLGDGWTHRCVIEGTGEPPDLVDDDELDEFDLPVPVLGWGALPDQYGRTTPDG